MEFCPRCGSLLLPKRGKKGIRLVCKKCGYEKPAKTGEKRYRVVERVPEDKKEKLTVLEKVDRREKEKLEEERELVKEYYEVFLDTMESEE